MGFQIDSVYHLYNRGNNREPIFFAEESYRFFTEKMHKYFLKHQVELIAYCLMPNHFHIVVRQRAPNQISKALQGLMTSYVKAMNIRHHRVGHLFQGRVQSRLVETELYCINLVRYLHLNPVVAGLVRQPDAWQHSDYRRWILNSEIQLRDQLIGNGKEYASFVADSLDIACLHAFDEFKD
jgi:REP element-mobilizing transposase RayT